jgi:two-component system response regulator YesN
MPKVLLVDDETIFRKGLQHMITEMDSDWTVIGEATDGLDALDKVDQYHPEFIITDIRMPRMDGIQLQYILKDRYPDIECIVMSGYNDFQYARDSLRMGAKDYLLKPVAREELYETLEGIKERWLIRKQEQAIPDKENRQVRQQLRQHILNGLLTGNVTDGELELIEEVGLLFPYPNFCCVIADLDRDSVEEERYYRSDPALFSVFMYQVIQEIVNVHMHGYACVTPDSNVAIILNYQDHPDGYLACTELVKLIKEQIGIISNLNITMGMGNEASDLEEIARSHKEAEMALLYRLILGGNRVFSYEIKSTHNHRMGYGSTHWVLLEQAVNEGNINDVHTITHTLINELCSNCSDPKVIQQQICKMILHFYETAMNMNMVEEWLKDTDIKDVLSSIYSISARQELIKRCQDMVGYLSQLIVLREANVTYDAIEIIVQHVNEHYDKPISLSSMAEKVYLNPSYLSSLFKAKLGITFSDFVTEVRIEESRKRLKYTDAKIASIAESTGFINLRHFNRVFKTQTHMTPKEYRNNQ